MQRACLATVRKVRKRTQGSRRVPCSYNIPILIRQYQSHWRNSQHLASSKQENSKSLAIEFYWNKKKSVPRKTKSKHNKKCLDQLFHDGFNQNERDQGIRISDAIKTVRLGLDCGSNRCQYEAQRKSTYGFERVSKT